MALLGLVGYGLVHGTEQARDRDELAARRDARDLATALRAFLRHERLLDLVPPAARFRVRDGSVGVDQEVGWLVAAPAPAADAVLDERLRQAQLAEFVQHDATAAAAQFEPALTEPDTTPGTHLPLLVAAAWQAHRAGDARADELQTRLLAAVQTRAPAAVADVVFARAIASAALLAAARQQRVPAELVPALVALPGELAAPMFARLAERGVLPPDLTARHAAIATRRELLLQAQRALHELPRTPLARALGERLLLWFPAAAPPGDGEGAVVDGAWCTTLPGLGTTRASPAPDLPPLPERGRSVFGASPIDGDDVVPGFWSVLPPVLPESSWLQQPSALAFAGAVLIAVFAASALAMLRAFRREAIATRTRADFLTGVTHELKTPVASIRLVAEVLQDDDVPPARQRQYFALLAGESTRLAGLIDNVLDLGQMERGERAYDLRPCDLGEVVRDAVAAFTPLAEQAGMRVDLHAATASIPAIADAGALQQALFAVCENARKYAAAGKVLAIAITSTATTCTIALRDFGPGVPAAENDGIFERFRRGSRQRVGNVPGVGLGLYLARRVALRHGGSLVCTPPQSGPGACFVFSLPLAST
jgi:signal transduction histidine kinase